MRAPPFRQRVDAAIAAAKAAGAARVKVTDPNGGSVEFDLVKSENGEVNDFDRKPVLPVKKEPR